MRKTLTILLLTLCSTILLGQEKNKQIGITYGAEKEILPKVGDTIKEYHPNNIVKFVKFRNLNEFTIQEFKENGSMYKSTIFPIHNLKNKTLTKYHSNGNIILIANYNMGIVHGYFQKFYTNGKPMQIGIYKRMKKIGEWKFFDETGDLIKKEHYKNGKLIE